MTLTNHKLQALSIRQPWAWLIVHGYKDIENRSWKTSYRGEFLVHAGKKFDKDAYDWVVDNFDINLPSVDELPTGGIVGLVTLEDIVETSVSPWFEGPLGYVLSNPKALEFIELRGQLGFFDTDISLDELKEKT